LPVVNVKVTGRCIQASQGIKVKHRIRSRVGVDSAWFSVEEGPGLGYGCDLVAVMIRVM